MKWGFGMFIRCTFGFLRGRNYLDWSLRWRMCFFPVVGGFVPVAWVVVFLLVAGVLGAWVGEAEVFVFLVWGSLFSVVFFCPSFSVSPLSLLLFRLVVVSISSGFCLFFVFVYFFPFPPFTKVHPSSLLGWDSVSECVLFLASVFVSVVSLVAVVVLLVAMVVAFWWQDREKCPSCLQFQQSVFLPSTMTVMVVFLYVIVWGIALNPPLSKIMINEKSPYAVPCAELFWV